MIITRYHNVEHLRITVEFLTPTFLGGADQHAELRAAPFKNLLRQWWRVAVGVEHSNHDSLLRAEGELFGSVLDESQASASKVKLVLTPGKNFAVNNAAFDLGKTRHPEVGENGMNVANSLYLGFGPITYARGQTEIKKYIAPGSTAELSLSFPHSHKNTIFAILQLINTFGAIGSRCRNGWGSIALSGEGFVRQNIQSFPTQLAVNLVGNTAKPYPTALGADDSGLLCWESDTLSDWKAAMKLLAKTYMTLRTSINIKSTGLQKRHILGYPVTNKAHSVDDWDDKQSNRTIPGRMPSQLRLLVKRNQEGPESVARILHLPHKLPKEWDAERLGTEFEVWKEVHNLLDHNEKLLGGNKQFYRCGR